MSQYLKQAQICLKIGKLCIVHGAMPWMVSSAASSSQQHYELAMPWLSQNETPHQSSLTTTSTTSILDWINELNVFAQSQIQQWQLSSTDLPPDGVWATRVVLITSAHRNAQRTRDSCNTVWDGYPPDNVFRLWCIPVGPMQVCHSNFMIPAVEKLNSRRAS
jgi:hypothetical protein